MRTTTAMSEDNVRWLRPQEPRDLPLQISFYEPVDDLDAAGGGMALRHEVHATAVRQDNGQTQFIDSHGTVVAAWDSSIVGRIEWPDGVCLVPREADRLWPTPREPWPNKVRKLREKRPNAYRRWENDEDERLAAELRAGKGLAELADLLGRGEAAILSRLIKLNLVDGDRGSSDAEEGQ